MNLADAGVEGVCWPRFGGGPDLLRQWLAELERTEWLASADLDAGVLSQLRALLAFAFGNVPWYRERLAAAGYHPDEPLHWDGFRAIPVLERVTVQAQGGALRPAGIPAAHGRIAEVATSGSTGRPVVVARSELTRLLWALVTAREHAWHRRDYRGRLAAIRWFRDGINGYPEGGRAPTWGPPIDLLHQTGPSCALAITASAAEQVEWLNRVQPTYLLVYPSLLPELVRESRAQGVRLRGLHHVRTVSEWLDPAHRALCRDAWGVPVHDIYSSHEIGYLALQCPGHEHLHVQSETVHVEVLDEQGQPCAPGEVGRVVVTALHNFAMPLIRYAIGDYAEVGDRCPCGRGLPVLRRILGRTRNMVTLPDGRRLWPRLGELRYAGILPITQHQVVQRDAARLDLRVVSRRRGTPDEERRLRMLVNSRIGHEFGIDVVYVDAIPRGPGGKFEEFRSEI